MSNLNNFQTSDVMTKNELSDSNNKNFMESKDDNYNDICNNMSINSQIKEESNEQNNKEKILTLSYNIKNEEVDNFVIIAQDLWIKLFCALIGETLPFCADINGIRIVDKTKNGFKPSIIFKFEISSASLIVLEIAELTASSSTITPFCIPEHLQFVLHIISI